jgi:peroxiredoxin
VLDTGEAVPSFSTPDQHGEPVSLADSEGRRVVV